jgi:organic hydroperoxide reductase OsmC/OhrA
MSEHKATLHWKKTTSDFSYKTYDRTHTVRFGGGSEIKASSAPEYLGKQEFVNPEEAFAFSISSCHLLTFLAIASMSNYVVEEYEDEAVAVLEKNNEGKMAVTKIHLKPKVKFSGQNIPDAEKLKKLHEKAHKECFIANSISSEVIVES